MELNKWVKASKSDGNGNCVEVRLTDEAVEVRDSKQDGQGPTHAYTYAEWAAFLDGAKNGEFDL
jgi:Domain of unknown function (DUF397)